jgi:hypothetical protein
MTTAEQFWVGWIFGYPAGIFGGIAGPYAAAWAGIIKPPVVTSPTATPPEGFVEIAPGVWEGYIEVEIPEDLAAGIEEMQAGAGDTWVPGETWVDPIP